MARGGKGVSKKARRRMYVEMTRRLTMSEIRQKRLDKERERKHDEWQKKKLLSNKLIRGDYNEQQ